MTIIRFSSTQCGSPSFHQTFAWAAATGDHAEHSLVHIGEATPVGRPYRGGVLPVGMGDPVHAQPSGGPPGDGDRPHVGRVTVEGEGDGGAVGREGEVMGAFCGGDRLEPPVRETAADRGGVDWGRRRACPCRPTSQPASRTAHRPQSCLSRFSPSKASSVASTSWPRLSRWYPPSWTKTVGRPRPATSRPASA